MRRTPLRKLCGTTIPEPFNSSGNILDVLFHTDIHVARTGFEFQWIAVRTQRPISAGMLTFWCESKVVRIFKIFGKNGTKSLRSLDL